MSSRFHEVWPRRALTIPGVLLLTALSFALAPALFLAGLAAALLGDRCARVLRGVALLLVWTAAESLGLAAAFALWLARPLLSSARSQRAHFRLQILWAAALFGALTRVLGLRVRFEDETRPRSRARAGARPLIVFARHASLLDALLPSALISVRHGTRLRHVLKRELLFDPCLDVIGNRLPNAFVTRSAADPAQEGALIAALARGLGAGEGVLLFPEGTRATPAKRLRALARIERADPERHARVSKLTLLMPPRTRGPLALLEAAPDADVLFLAHTGLEGVGSLGALFSGRLAGRTLRVRSWRVDAGALPQKPAERMRWLDDEWARMERWVLSQREESTT